MNDALKMVIGVAWLVLIVCSMTLELLGEGSFLSGAASSPWTT